MKLQETAQGSWVGYKRVLETLAVKSEIVDSSNATVPENTSGNIEFRNVSFKYKKSNKNIFQNLNLKIQAGKYVALVGSPGIGKSTLCNLIPRFYDVSSGETLFDDINIKNIKLESLRQNIGFVQQDTFSFSGVVMENIRYGGPDATE